MSDTDHEAIDPIDESTEPAGSPNGVPDMIWNQLPPQTRQLFTVLGQEDGLAKVLLQPVYGDDGDGKPTTSQAEVVADMFNIMRLDTKMLAQAVGIEMEVKRMTPERAAELLQGLVKGENFGLIEEFNRMEDQRERVLLELSDEDTLAKHRQIKVENLFSQIADPEHKDFTDDDSEPDES